jgi:hypothetical protein
MGLLSRLIGTASRAARTGTARRPVRRRPVARRPVTTRPGVRRGSPAGGLIGAVRGFLRGSGRARI